MILTASAKKGQTCEPRRPPLYNSCWAGGGGRQIQRDYSHPLLLDLLDLRDCTVTIDALGCQTAIAAQIVQRGGQYVLALKGNQPTMLADVAGLFDDAPSAATGLWHDHRHDRGEGSGAD